MSNTEPTAVVETFDERKASEVVMPSDTKSINSNESHVGDISAVLVRKEKANRVLEAALGEHPTKVTEPNAAADATIEGSSSTVDDMHTILSSSVDQEHKAVEETNKISEHFSSNAIMDDNKSLQNDDNFSGETTDGCLVISSQDKDAEVKTDAAVDASDTITEEKTTGMVAAIGSSSKRSRPPFKYDPSKISLRFLFANKDGLAVTIECNPSDTVGMVKSELIAVWPEGTS